MTAVRSSSNKNINEINGQLSAMARAVERFGSIRDSSLRKAGADLGTIIRRVESEVATKMRNLGLAVDNTNGGGANDGKDELVSMTSQSTIQRIIIENIIDSSTSASTSSSTEKRTRTFIQLTDKTVNSFIQPFIKACQYNSIQAGTAVKESSTQLKNDLAINFIGLECLKFAITFGVIQPSHLYQTKESAASSSSGAAESRREGDSLITAIIDAIVSRASSLVITKNSESEKFAMQSIAALLHCVECIGKHSVVATATLAHTETPETASASASTTSSSSAAVETSIALRKALSAITDVLLRGEGSITLQISGKGALGQIIERVVSEVTECSKIYNRNNNHQSHTANTNGAAAAAAISTSSEHQRNRLDASLDDVETILRFLSELVAASGISGTLAAAPMPSKQDNVLSGSGGGAAASVGPQQDDDSGEGGAAGLSDEQREQRKKELDLLRKNKASLLKEQQYSSTRTDLGLQMLHQVMSSLAAASPPSSFSASTATPSSSPSLASPEKKISNSNSNSNGSAAAAVHREDEEPVVTANIPAFLTNFNAGGAKNSTSSSTKKRTASLIGTLRRDVLSCIIPHLVSYNANNCKLAFQILVSVVKTYPFYAACCRELTAVLDFLLQMLEYGNAQGDHRHATTSSSAAGSGAGSSSGLRLMNNQTSPSPDLVTVDMRSAGSLYHNLTLKEIFLRQSSQFHRQQVRKSGELIAPNSPVITFKQRTYAVTVFCRLMEHPEIFVGSYINMDCSVGAPEMTFRYWLALLNQLKALDRPMEPTTAQPRGGVTLAASGATNAGAGGGGTSSVASSRAPSSLEVGGSSSGAGSEPTVSSQQRIQQQRQAGTNADLTPAQVEALKHSLLNALVAGARSLSVFSRGGGTGSSVGAGEAPAHMNISQLLSEKFRQERVLNKFNAGKFDDTFEMAKELGMMEDARSPSDVGRLLKSTPGLDKAAIGEFLGKNKDFRMQCLASYIDMFDFASKTVDVALRDFMSAFKPAGESEVIGRMMELFGARYTQQNPGVFNGPDTAEILGFALVMLNTNTHNAAVKASEKMKISGFLSQLRGMDNGQNIPQPVLEGMFDRITGKEIKLAEDAMTVQRMSEVLLETPMSVQVPRVTAVHRQSSQHEHPQENDAADDDNMVSPQVSQPREEDAAPSVPVSTLVGWERSSQSETLHLWNVNLAVKFAQKILRDAPDGTIVLTTTCPSSTVDATPKAAAARDGGRAFFQLSSGDRTAIGVLWARLWPLLLSAIDVVANGYRATAHIKTVDTFYEGLKYAVQLSASLGGECNTRPPAEHEPEEEEQIPAPALPPPLLYGRDAFIEQLLRLTSLQDVVSLSSLTLLSVTTPPSVSASQSYLNSGRSSMMSSRLTSNRTSRLDLADSPLSMSAVTAGGPRSPSTASLRGGHGGGGTSSNVTGGAATTRAQQQMQINAAVTQYGLKYKNMRAMTTLLDLVTTESRYLLQTFLLSQQSSHHFAPTLADETAGESGGGGRRTWLTILMCLIRTISFLYAAPPNAPLPANPNSINTNPSTSGGGTHATNNITTLLVQHAVESHNIELFHRYLSVNTNVKAPLEAINHEFRQLFASLCTTATSSSSSSTATTGVISDVGSSFALIKHFNTVLFSALTEELRALAADAATATAAAPALDSSFTSNQSRGSGGSSVSGRGLRGGTEPLTHPLKTVENRAKAITAAVEYTVMFVEAQINALIGQLDCDEGEGEGEDANEKATRAREVRQGLHAIWECISYQFVSIINVFEKMFQEQQIESLMHEESVGQGNTALRSNQIRTGGGAAASALGQTSGAGPNATGGGPIQQIGQVFLNSLRVLALNFLRQRKKTETAAAVKNPKQKNKTAAAASANDVDEDAVGQGPSACFFNIFLPFELTAEHCSQPGVRNAILKALYDFISRTNQGEISLRPFEWERVMVICRLCATPRDDGAALASSLHNAQHSILSHNSGGTIGMDGGGAGGNVIVEDPTSAAASSVSSAVAALLAERMRDDEITIMTKGVACLQYAVTFCSAFNFNGFMTLAQACTSYSSNAVTGGMGVAGTMLAAGGDATSSSSGGGAESRTSTSTTAAKSSIDLLELCCLFARYGRPRLGSDLMGQIDTLLIEDASASSSSPSLSASPLGTQRGETDTPSQQQPHQASFTHRCKQLIQMAQLQQKNKGDDRILIPVVDVVDVDVVQQGQAKKKVKKMTENENENQEEEEEEVDGEGNDASATSLSSYTTIIVDMWLGLFGGYSGLIMSSPSQSLRLAAVDAMLRTLKGGSSNDDLSVVGAEGEEVDEGNSSHPSHHHEFFCFPTPLSASSVSGSDSSSFINGSDGGAAAAAATTTAEVWKAVCERVLTPLLNSIAYVVASNSDVYNALTTGSSLGGSGGTTTAGGNTFQHSNIPVSPLLNHQHLVNGTLPAVTTTVTSSDPSSSSSSSTNPRLERQQAKQHRLAVNNTRQQLQDFAYLFERLFSGLSELLYTATADATMEDGSTTDNKSVSSTATNTNLVVSAAYKRGIRQLLIETLKSCFIGGSAAHSSSTTYQDEAEEEEEEEKAEVKERATAAAADVKVSHINVATLNKVGFSVLERWMTSSVTLEEQQWQKRAFSDFDDNKDGEEEEAKKKTSDHDADDAVLFTASDWGSIIRECVLPVLDLPGALDSVAAAPAASSTASSIANDEHNSNNNAAADENPQMAGVAAAASRFATSLVDGPHKVGFLTDILLTLKKATRMISMIEDEFNNSSSSSSSSVRRGGGGGNGGGGLLETCVPHVLPALDRLEYYVSAVLDHLGSSSGQKIQSNNNTSSSSSSSSNNYGMKTPRQQQEATRQSIQTLLMNIQQKSMSLASQLLLSQQRNSSGGEQNSDEEEQGEVDDAAAAENHGITSSSTATTTTTTTKLAASQLIYLFSNRFQLLAKKYVTLIEQRQRVTLQILQLEQQQSSFSYSPTRALDANNGNIVNGSFNNLSVAGPSSLATTSTSQILPTTSTFEAEASASIGAEQQQHRQTLKLLNEQILSFANGIQNILSSVLQEGGASTTTATTATTNVSSKEGSSKPPVTSKFFKQFCRNNYGSLCLLVAHCGDGNGSSTAIQSHSPSLPKTLSSIFLRLENFLEF